MHKINVWLNKQSLAAKFKMLSMLIGLGIISLLLPLTLDHYTKLSYTQAELQGMQGFGQLLTLVKTIEKYRDALELKNLDEISVTQQAIHQHLESFRGWMDKSMTDRQKNKPTLMQVDATILRLQEQVVGDGRPDQLVPEFIQLNKELFNIFQMIAEYSGLTLDPEANTYHLYEALFLELLPILESAYALDNSAWQIEADQQLTQAEQIELVRWHYMGQSRVETLQRAVNMASTESSTILQKLSKLNELFTQSVLIKPEGITDIATIVKAGELAHEIHNLTSLCIDEISQLLQSRLQARVKAQELTAVRHLIVISILMLLVWFIVRILYRSISNAVELIRTGTKLIAAGDLTHQINIPGSDEMAEIGEAVNFQRQSFRTLLTGIFDSGHAVESAAQSFSQIASNVLITARENTRTAEQVSQHVANAKMGMSAIADSSSAAHQDTQLAEKMARQGGAVISSTVTKIADISSEVNSAAAALARLHTETTQILSVVVLIREIADQTNLLALNAAIEAARAGESGRGFAVVADEVRLLAVRAGQATKEIDKAIDRVISMTNDAQMIIGTGVEQLAGVQQLSQQVLEAVDSIIDATQRSESAVEIIHVKLHEQRALTEEISAGVNHITLRTGENSQAVSLAEDSATVLMTIADDLRRHMNTFKIKESIGIQQTAAQGVELF